MMDAINFVRPISRCDIQQDSRLITMRCNNKPKVKSVSDKLVHVVIDKINSPRNSSGYFWRY